MELFIWILFGALVGWVASMVMGGGGGLLWNIVVGIIGAMIGGFVMRFFNIGSVGGFNVYSFLVALLGACILIAIVRVLT